MVTRRFDGEPWIKTKFATRGPVRQYMVNTNIHTMNKKQKKLWIKPSMKDTMIFFECTCYSGAV